MKSILVVLWLYQPVPWAYHGIAFSEGWFNYYTFNGPGSYADCMVARKLSKFEAMCLKIGEAPKGKVSEVIK